MKLPTSGLGTIISRRPRVTLAAAVLIGLDVSVAPRALPPPPVGRTPVLQAVLDDAASPSAGPASATLTVMVFTDDQCPICRATDPALNRVRQQRPDVRFIYKRLADLGPRSQYAARVTLAADRQGRYVAVHNALMRSPGLLDDDAVRRAAIGAGVDWSRREADLASYGAAYDAQLKRQAFEAWSLGLEGTPGYVVGTDLYRGGLGELGLKRAISHASR